MIVSAADALEPRVLLSADTWSQRGGDAGHTGSTLDDPDAAAFETAWTQPLGYKQSGTGSWRERAVASDGERVYRTALEGYAPSGTYHVIAYDLETGDEVWRRSLIGRSFEGVSEPTVEDGIVYVNRAGHSGISGGTSSDLPRLYGFDAETGATILQRTYAAQWGSGERPVVADGRLIVEDGYYGGISSYDSSTLNRQWFQGRSAAYNQPFATVDDEYAYAFGSEVYRLSDGARLPNLEHPDGFFISGAMATQTGQIILQGGNGLVAFDGDTHEVNWTRPLGEPVRAVASQGGQLAVATDTGVLLLDEVDGSTNASWTAPASLVSGEIILTPSHVFVQSADFRGATVHVVDLQTLEEVWSFTHQYSQNGRMEIAMAGDTLVLSHQQFVRAFRAAENDPPVAVGDRIRTDEDVPFTVNVLSNDSDPNGDPLTVTLISQPSSGTAVVNADQTVTYTPDPDSFGVDRFLYEVSDGRGGSDFTTVFVDVQEVNDDPVASDATFAVTEHADQGTVVGSVEASDIHDATLDFAIAEIGTGFAIDEAGLLTVEDPAAIDFESGPVVTLSVVVTDGRGGSATAAVSVNVEDVVLEGGVDLVPGDVTNTVSRRAKTVELAILGTAGFDPATQVDLASLRLSSAGGSETVTRHRKHGIRFEQVDVNGDGVLDLVVRFNTRDLRLSQDTTELQLTGSLLDGREFSQALAVQVLAGKPKRR